MVGSDLGNKAGRRQWQWIVAYPAKLEPMGKLHTELAWKKCAESGGASVGSLEETG